MLRKIARFLLWLGLFGLFLTFAAYSSGYTRPDLLIASLILLVIARRVLRQPAAPFSPTQRFRTLRRLGLIKGDHESEQQT